MLEVEKPAEMDAHVGRALGTSDWLLVSQEMIDLFAQATGDHQWIHVDRERAKREMPGGRTIAHGYLTLSLVPVLSQTVFRITGRSRGINYGSNKVRYTNTVPAGSRVRLTMTLKSSEPIEGGRRLIIDNVIEIEGESRPALVAEIISLAYD